MSEMQNLSTHRQIQCIRQSAGRLYLGLLLGIEFALMDTGFIGCLVNPPPRNPEAAPPQLWVIVLFTIFVGAFMATMTGAAVWMVAEYVRNRLWISEELITLRTCFHARQIETSSVTKIEWKPGAIAVTANGQRTSIDISAYREEDIADLFDYFHNRFPLEIQHDWLKYVDSIERAHQPQVPKYCRWLAIPIIIVFLAGGALTAAAWYSYGGVRILLGSLAFIAVGLWYVWSFATFRDENALIRRKIGHEDRS